MTRLTLARLEAMSTALSSMCAGYDDEQQGDWGDTRIEDLEAAHDWVLEEIRRRENRKAKR